MANLLGARRTGGKTPCVANSNIGRPSAGCNQAWANADAGPARDAIQFSIGSRVQRSPPSSPLPLVTSPVVIDGSSQPGFGGTPIIELNGSSAGGGANGLTIAATGSTVKGLVI